MCPVRPLSLENPTAETVRNLAPKGNVEDDEADLGPFSYCDEVEIKLSGIKVIAVALKKFCSENRNVHKSIKEWASELITCANLINPWLSRLIVSTSLTGSFRKSACWRDIDLSTSI